MVGRRGNVRVGPRWVRALSGLAVLAILSLGAGAAHAADKLPAHLAPMESIPNWSGYVATHQPGKKVVYKSVTGTWTVPKATCSKKLGATSSAAWVGIGGYTTTNQEEVGTNSNCSKQGKPVYFAWFELVPYLSYQTFPNINHKVYAGDTITGLVRILNYRFVRLEVKNVTQGWDFVKTINFSSQDTSTADWVMESPATCVLYTCQEASLTNFGAITMRNISAVGNGATGNTHLPEVEGDPDPARADEADRARHRSDRHRDRPQRETGNRRVTRGRDTREVLGRRLELRDQVDPRGAEEGRLRLSPRREAPCEKNGTKMCASGPIARQIDDASRSRPCRRAASRARARSPRAPCGRGEATGRCGARGPSSARREGPGPSPAPMYIPVAIPFASTPTRQQAQRSTVPCASGTSQSTRSITAPITIAFASVPSPGRSRSGIQNSRTTTPTRIDQVPIAIPVCRSRPWWSTSHGTSPCPPITSSDELTP